MVDLERLDEALTWDLEYVAAIAKGDPDLTFEPLEVIVNAARAYRDYLADPVAAAANLDGAEPDYEAAELLFEPGADLHWITSERLAVDALVRRVVDAALAGRKVLPEATR